VALVAVLLEINSLVAGVASAAAVVVKVVVAATVANSHLSTHPNSSTGTQSRPRKRFTQQRIGLLTLVSILALCNQ